MNPKNVGEIPDADGIGNVGNPVCGDIMRLYIKVRDNVIVDAKFKTFGCLPQDEEIVLSEGGWKEISSIINGDSVINSQGENTNVVETYVRDYEGNILRFIPFVSPYNTFSVTPNHPILSIKRAQVKSARRSSYICDWIRVKKDELLSKNPEYVRAEQLEVGDYLIFTCNNEIRNSKHFTKNVMRLIGYYLSEGYITANGSVVAFAFNKNESKLIGEIKLLLKNITGKDAKFRVRGSVTEVYICSRKLARFLYNVGGRLARKKSLSNDVLLLPFGKQWELISTFIKGDGDVYKRRSHNSNTYRIKTTSKNLAIQFQEMLARGGIFCSIRRIYTPPHLIEGRRIKGSMIHVLSFKLKRNHHFVHTSNKHFLVPIKKIEKRHYNGRVYNLQVSSEFHSYLVKGFVVHNCGAAIATSSMVTEMVKGKTIEEALKLTNAAVAEALGGLPKIKMHCSLLAEQALKSAIDDYYKKRGLPSPVKLKPEEEHAH